MTTYPLGLHSPYISKGAKGLLKRAVLLLIKDLHEKNGELTQEEREFIIEIGDVPVSYTHLTLPSSDLV